MHKDIPGIETDIYAHQDHQYKPYQTLCNPELIVISISDIIIPEQKKAI